MNDKIPSLLRQNVASYMKPADCDLYGNQQQSDRTRIYTDLTDFHRFIFLSVSSVPSVFHHNIILS